MARARTRVELRLQLAYPVVPLDGVSGAAGVGGGRGGGGGGTTAAAPAPALVPRPFAAAASLVARTVAPKRPATFLGGAFVVLLVGSAARDDR